MAYSELIAEGLFLVTQSVLSSHFSASLEYLNSSKGRKVSSISEFSKKIGYLVISYPDDDSKSSVYIEFTPDPDDTTKNYCMDIPETFTELQQLIKENSEILTRTINT